MNLLQKLLMFVGVTGIVAGSAGLMMPSAAYAANGQGNCEKRILTFPVWYRGVYDPSNCEIKSPSQVKGGLSGFVWQIVLNIIEIALQVVGYLAVGYIIYGGYRYIVSTGSADGMAKAKTTILNAVIGLVLSIASIAIVNVVAGALR